MSDKQVKTTKGPGSPGFSGAVKDAVKAIADYGTPKVMKGHVRKRAYDDAVNEAVRGRQSTDSNN